MHRLIVASRDGFVDARAQFERASKLDPEDGRARLALQELSGR